VFDEELNDDEPDRHEESAHGENRNGAEDFFFSKLTINHRSKEDCKVEEDADERNRNAKDSRIGTRRDRRAVVRNGAFEGRAKERV